jgi:hypothetical protein
MKLYVVVAIALLVASCQPSFGHESGRKRHVVDPSDPCSLLSPDLIASAANIEVSRERRVQSRAEESVPLCMYPTQPFNSVTLHLESPVSKTDFVKRLQRDPLNTNDVSGIGDMGFVHAGASIQTFVDGTVVGISAQHLTTVEETERALIAIAKRAVAQLSGDSP